MSSLDIFKEYETIEESINNLHNLNEEFFDFEELYTNEDTNVEMNKETHTETNEKVNNEIIEETDKETDEETNEKVNNEIIEETHTETNKETDKETDKETNKETDKETDEEMNEETDEEMNEEINYDLKKNLINIKNIINGKEWYNIGKTEINDIQKIINNNIIIDTINKDELDTILNTIKSEIRYTNKIKDKILNGFLNVINNKYINKYNKHIDEQNVKNESERINIILKQKENKKLIQTISKYKTNVINMIKKIKENNLGEKIYNFKDGDKKEYNKENKKEEKNGDKDEEIIKNIINKYIYIIEITKIIIYIIQKYIDNKNSKKVNDILIEQMMKINKFIGICKLYEINKNKEIYYILRNDNKIDKNNEIIKSIKNVIILYENIIEEEYNNIIKEIEYVEELIENDVDFYINFEFNCYNEYVKKYGSKNFKNIYYKNESDDKTKNNMVNDIKKSIENNLDKNISQCILTDELGRGLLYGTKKDIGILNLLSNSCIDFFELKEIVRINKNNENIEKSKINIINDINLDKIKGKDIYLLDKGLVKNYEDNDIIKEEYKIKKKDGDESIITIITFKGYENNGQEEIVKMKKDMVDKLSYIDLNKYNMEDIETMKHIKNKTRIIYIKNIESSDKLNKIMENL